MKKDVNVNSYISVDENQMIGLKIEINHLPEKWIEEYFTTSESILHKHISKILLSCMKSIGASEVINDEDIVIKEK